ncbi:universal stress protein [Clostridium sardiniense]|uniref:Universal stress protein n=1 Tax=Clostridium sardiniense TaxID=29369 RepID=A0ABS7KYA9_CLOSR|nr:universal stress protein [Clostridium sardiniense]MBY0755801.1 universal stress protein [Clostridium sardiniense]MDQ0459971.1 nucleotide-binding universal stress UspA family protein [Clostridium sardiniense]
MTKKKILIPIDGSDRSLISLNYLKNNFKPEDVEVTLMNVREIVFINGMAVTEEVKDAEVIGKRILREASEEIEEFDCKREFSFGYAGDEILRYAEENDIDIILMAKNTKKKFTTLVGSVTAHVVKRAKCIMIIIPELY